MTCFSILVKKRLGSAQEENRALPVLVCPHSPTPLFAEMNEASMIMSKLTKKTTSDLGAAGVAAGCTGTDRARILPACQHLHCKVATRTFKAARCHDPPAGAGSRDSPSLCVLPGVLSGAANVSLVMKPLPVSEEEPLLPR